jgi:hypothetical protein
MDFYFSYTSSPASTQVASSDGDLPSIEIDQIRNAAGVLLRGVESYLQEFFNASACSHLAALGIAPNEVARKSALFLGAVLNGHRPSRIRHPTVSKGSRILPCHYPQETYTPGFDS